MPIFWQNEVLIISELRYANSKILCPSLSAKSNPKGLLFLRIGGISHPTVGGGTPSALRPWLCRLPAPVDYMAKWGKYLSINYIRAKQYIIIIKKEPREVDSSLGSF